MNKWEAFNDWVCVDTETHNCAGGAEWPHEPGCGLEPLFQVNGDEAAKAIVEDHNSLLNQRDLLGQALGRILVASGAVIDQGLTGPELLLAAEDYSNYLDERSGKTHPEHDYVQFWDYSLCPRGIQGGRQAHSRLGLVHRLRYPSGEYSNAAHACEDVANPVASTTYRRSVALEDTTDDQAPQ